MASPAMVTRCKDAEGADSAQADPPKLEPPAVDAPSGQPAADPGEQATAVVTVRPRLPHELQLWWEAHWPGLARGEAFPHLDWSDPQVAERLAAAVAAMPEAGTEFLGFQLIAELGRGALGRVFLARQQAMADRLVVLKISAEIDGELRNLAQLQHTNVVPIHSVHREGALQAVCMPYFGSTTLAHVLNGIQALAALPESGKGLISTLVGRRSTTNRLGHPSTVSLRTQVTEPSPADQPIATSPAAELADTSSGPTPILEMLQGLSYVEAVLWLGARLADGLAHAHERGILHRDLKPANVLLTDDGQPMLLDFNLSQDTKLGAGAWVLVGGTLPYMAPEQLEAYRQRTCVLTLTSDLYALGVILYELLTGRHPFAGYTGSMGEVLDRMIADRRSLPASLRGTNSAVTPAVDAIVRHCLEPDPARRYQSARELREDLQRQLDDRPLRFVSEPSRWERLRKWARRHPRATSGASVAVLAGTLVIALSCALMARNEHVARLQATETLRRFLQDKQSVQFYLAARSATPGSNVRGLEHGRKLLDSYEAVKNPSWQNSDAVKKLSPDDRERLREQIGELLFFYGQAITFAAWDKEESSERSEQLQLALNINQQARTCYDPEGVPRAVALQRAQVLELLGRREEATSQRQEAELLPLRSARDRYMLAAEAMMRGEWRRALPMLTEATSRGPQDFWAWFLLGVCHDGLAHSNDAAACYSTCIAIWPSLPWSYYNRGLAHLRLMNYLQARADFDQAIQLDPNESEMLIQRALAEQGLQHYADAVRDLTRALELGADPSRAQLLRAEAHRRAGEAEAARADRLAGLSREPRDAQGWLARGYARLATEPQEALGDFDRALQLDPRSLTGLQNKAHALSRLDRPTEAVACLDQAVEQYPDFVFARAGRAVLLARLGRREAAHRDADECLRRDRQPLVLYQLAGVYALTSREQPLDRQRALGLLSTALQKGCGFELIEQDRDLAPLREDPRFGELVTAVRAIRAATAERK